MMPNPDPNHLVPDPNHLARLLASQIPEQVLKAIGPRELNAKLVEAARLTMQSRDQTLPPELRRAAGLRARATLQSQPEAVTRQQHAQLVRKAATAPPRQAEAIRRQAAQLLEDNPITTGTTVRKAKADPDAAPIPVFNADGRLIGVCDEQDIVPVAGAGGGRDKTAGDPAPAPAAAPVPASNPAAAPVAKGARIYVYDQWNRRYTTDRRSVRTTARRAKPGR